MLVLGDSHARAICNGAATMGYSVVGGVIGPGRDLDVGFYKRKGAGFLFLKEKVDALYRRALTDAGVSCIGEIKMPILCLFGMNIHYLSRAELWAGYTLEPGGDGHFLSAGAFREIVRGMVSGALQFCTDLKAMGLAVYSALPPRGRHPGSLPSFFAAIEDVLVEAFRAVGVIVVDHRPWSLDAGGMLQSRFARPGQLDNVHGSDGFGEKLLEQLREAVSLDRAANAAA